MSQREVTASPRVTLRIEDVPREWTLPVRQAARQLAMHLGRDVELWIDGKCFYIPARLAKH
ncbi:MAG: hypothetical protein JJ693_07950 [Acidithiobacillus sp.]|nr:hypothetical protein [Acidithiobacillus sp.]